MIPGPRPGRDACAPRNQFAEATKVARSPAGYGPAHGFTRKANQDYQFYATIAFMQENLLK